MFFKQQKDTPCFHENKFVTNLLEKAELFNSPFSKTVFLNKQCDNSP